MAQQGTITKPTVGVIQNFVQGTCAATDDYIVLNRFATWNYVGIQLTGTWTGTVTFEVCMSPPTTPTATDPCGGSTFVAVSVTPTNSVTTTTTATANGGWSVQNTGFSQVRARFSTASTGTVIVSLKSLPSQY